MKMWQLIVVFGGGCFWLGFLSAALMAAAGRADDQAERMSKNLRRS